MRWQNAREGTWVAVDGDHTIRALKVVLSGQIDTDFMWLYIYSISLFLSFIATLLATYHMRRLRDHVFRSTVHFVTTNFLISSSFHAFCGGIFYTLLTIKIQQIQGEWRNSVHADQNGRFQLDLDTVANQTMGEFVQGDNKQDGAEAAYVGKLIISDIHPPPIIMLFLGLENICFVLQAYWIVLLTLELYKLAKTTIDRGGVSERKVIRQYGQGAVGIVGFITICLLLKMCFSQDPHTINGFHFFSIFEMAISIVSILYATGALWDLKRRGRQNEHIHGTFMASPLYRRLKLLVIVCAIFTLPYCIVQIVLLSIDATRIDDIPDYIVGIALTFYYLIGTAQALVTGGSQQCCFRLFESCIPTHIKHDPHWRTLTCHSHDPFDQVPLHAPSQPIFVNTDIESSSALWALAPQHVINEAQQIHDDILRSALPKYQGYEITTAGDAFQLAFHTIDQAVGYCLEVQLMLVHAKWPRELDGLVPNTKTERVLHGIQFQKVFNGLRVRMGIHDTLEEEEGSLVTQIHPVTGKTVYIGASELIGREIGDVGYGGQIIVTQRIATHLRKTNSSKYLDMTGIAYRLDPYGLFDITTLDLTVNLYEITPKAMSKRRKLFKLRKENESMNKRIKSIILPDVTLDNKSSLVQIHVDDAHIVGIQESQDVEPMTKFHPYK